MVTLLQSALLLRALTAEAATPARERVVCTA